MPSFSMVVGKAEIMDLCADQRVIGAGTFNGYPLGVSASLATITYVESDDGLFYRRVAANQDRLMTGLREITARHGQQWLIQGCPGVITFYPAPFERAWSMAEWYTVADHDLGERFREALYDNGVLVMFRGRWYINGATTLEDIDGALEIVDRCFAQL